MNMISKPQDDGLNTQTRIKWKDTHRNSSRLDLETTDCDNLCI